MSKEPIMPLKDASRETRLQWFARQVIDAMWQGGDVDGGDIQGWAKSAGLILEHVVTDTDYKAARVLYVEHLLDPRRVERVQHVCCVVIREKQP